ncbi:MAG: hypothetical protein WCP85_30015 [Mariniphaga sp.]
MTTPTTFRDRNFGKEEMTFRTEKCGKPLQTTSHQQLVTNDKPLRGLTNGLSDSEDHGKSLQTTNHQPLVANEGDRVCFCPTSIY